MKMNKNDWKAQKRYREKHKEKINSNALIRYHSFTKSKKKKLQERSLELRTKRREKLIKILGGKCHICKTTVEKGNKFDFHNKNDEKHPNLIGYYENNENFIEDFILLCNLCHRGVTFCNKILKMNWETIEKLGVKHGKL